MTVFKKFTSIDKMSNTLLTMNKRADSFVWMTEQNRAGEIKNKEMYDENGNFTLKFRAKIKLHGTNAAVNISEGNIIFQKRSGSVDVVHDNAGFASWATTVKWKTDKDAIIFGEWAGPGVQKTDAVSLIDKKYFFVFGVQVDDNMIVEPELIKEYLPEHDQILVLPWFTDVIELSSDLGAKINSNTAYLLNRIVQSIGEEDPYVKEMFNVSGAGEGLVVTPYHESGIVDLEFYNTFIYKVKSEAHLTQKTKSPSASVYIEIPGSVTEFADQFVTEARCNQMVNEHLGGSFESKGIGDFIKYINEDIIKESKEEFAALNVEWKMVAREVSKRAIEWFKNKQNGIV